MKIEVKFEEEIYRLINSYLNVKKIENQINFKKIWIKVKKKLKQAKLVILFKIQNYKLWIIQIYLKKKNNKAHLRTNQNHHSVP